MSDLHEFTMLSFNDGVEDAEQLQTMEHVVWASEPDLEASTRLDDDPAVATLFERFDPDTVTYTCGRRVEPE